MTTEVLDYLDVHFGDEMFDRYLNDRERKILIGRFALNGGEKKSLEAIGKELGVTRERVRQIQNLALSKLRRAINKLEKEFL